MASIYEPKVWNSETSTWEDNPDYVQVAREQTVGEFHIQLFWESRLRKWRVKVERVGMTTTTIHSAMFDTPEPAIQAYDNAVAEYTSITEEREPEPEPEPEFHKIEVEHLVPGITNEQLRDSFPDTSEAESYADSYPDGFAGRLIVYSNQAPENPSRQGGWYVRMFNTNPYTDEQISLYGGKDFISSDEAQATTYYQEQIAIAEEDRQAALTMMVEGEVTNQNRLDEIEYNRLAAERHQSSEIRREVVEINQTTKELKTSLEGLETFDLTGKVEWLADGQVLLIHDDDWDSYTSGAVKIVFKPGYEFDVRIGIESAAFSDQLISEAIDPEVYDVGPPDSPWWSLSPVDSVLSFKPTNGGTVEIDVDKVGGNGIRGFYLSYNGRTLTYPDWKINDEMYLNISYPKQVIEVEVTVIRDGHGNIIEEKERIIEPDYTVYDDDDDDDDGGDDSQESSVGWWILGGILLVGVGWFLWRMSRKNAQNRQTTTSAQPAVAQNPAPVVVNVEASQ